ncbi:hypothetical protein [Rhodopirellula sp. P2]|uniref:hypothetical protein n=1 Tax=Rhodopirellula sp. P2 TaxID=2127060 RepID=UPI0023677947|nr:hypothetical protein [Rhodopirellula sp. P2]WDQ17078.1 hypothetical protein PSR62_00655 [Rhodopirellula sp. P2]
MPKPFVVAIAAFAIVAFFQIQLATAQHWHGHGHGTYHHSDHASIHDHSNGGCPYDASHHSDDYSYDYNHAHAPITLGYGDIRLNQVHGDTSVYCPAHSGCPLQYDQPVYGRLPGPMPRYRDVPYRDAPRQNGFPNGSLDSNHNHSHDHDGNSHDGHDHSDHSHDGHSHAPLNPNGQTALPFRTPDRQPMEAPTLPNRNAVPPPPRFNAPSNRQAPSSNPPTNAPPTNNGPIRMDGPPPSLTTLSKPIQSVS